jgi:hypothetical protein
MGPSRFCVLPSKYTTCELLAAAVDHDKAGVVEFVDALRRQEAAGGQQRLLFLTKIKVPN